jgi:glycosyltransferase involved in cell wall biosynthesis
VTIRIVHVISGLGVGGAERALFNLLSALSPDERTTSTVFSLTSLGTYGPKIEGLGISVQVLGLGRNPTTWLGLLALRKHLRHEAPEVLVSWMYHANIVAWLASRWLSEAPLLVWNIRHSLYDLNEEKPLTRWVIRAHKWLNDGVGAIIYNSQLSRHQHTEFGIYAAESMVIPNGFDTVTWHPDANDRAALRQILGIPLDARVVGHVGRYHALKDQANLLEAMRLVMQRHTNVHLLLIGREVGPTNPILKEYFEHLPLDRVHALGECLDVHLLMRVMDVFCLSSRSEAFPNVLGEAMSSGVVCTTTDAGDARLIVGETGHVVPIRDGRALAQSLLELVEKDGEELISLGIKARQRIVQNFSMDETLRAYRRVIYKRSINSQS